MLRWPQCMEIKGFFGKKRCMFRTRPARTGKPGTMPPPGQAQGEAEGKPGNGIVAERFGRICGGRRSPQAQGPPALFHPPDVGVVCSPPAAAMKEAPGAEQRGKGAYRGRFGTRGVAESKAREARRGRPGGASAEKRRRNIPRREQHAQAEQQSPHLSQKARAFLFPSGAGSAVNTPVG